MSHDGYARRHGLIHRRLLILSPNGRELRGEDLLGRLGGDGGHGRSSVVEGRFRSGRWGATLGGCPPNRSAPQ